MKDSCRYETICKQATKTCSEDYVYCKLFADYAHQELKVRKERDEEQRELHAGDVGLLRVINSQQTKPRDCESRDENGARISFDKDKTADTQDFRIEHGEVIE